MDFNRLLFVWTVLFFITTGILHSQEDNFIKGVLLDSKTKEPVVFATVRIQGKAVGVISNQDGSFKIPATFKKMGYQLVISSLGYKNKNIELSNLQLKVTNTIYLNQETQQLQEVVVQGNRKPIKNLDNKDILKKAIQRIPTNYPTTGFSLVGYYRDYQVKDDTYYNLNEAVLEVYDRGFSYDDYATTREKLLDYKLNYNFKRDSIISKPYNYSKKDKIIENAFLPNQGGNEFSILRVHDAIRNYKKNSYSYVYVLRENFINGHNFIREPDTFIDNEPLYVFAFGRDEDKNLVQGKIYISKKNFTILRLDYSAYSRKGNLKRYQFSGNNRSGLSTNGFFQQGTLAENEAEKILNSEVYSKQIGALIFRVNEEYQEKEGKAYLNYISLTNTFQVTLPSEFQLIKQIVNYDDSYVELTFNNSPDIRSASNKKKYALFDKNGKRLRISEVKVKNKKVFIYPDAMKAKFNYIKSARNELFNAEVDINLGIKNIKDVYGNVFNRSKKQRFSQFREFFVQKINPPNSAPVERQQEILKTIPLFDSRQPISKESKATEYWMNSPLKKAVN